MTVEPEVGHPVRFDAVFGGSVFCDLVLSGVRLPDAAQSGGEVFADGFALAPGGTANRAVAAARCGIATALFGVLGRDPLGDQVAALLEAEDGLDLRFLQRHPSAHTPVTVALTNAHDRTFVTYEEPGTTVPDRWPGPLPTAATCHTGLADRTPEWVGQLRAAGTTVFGGVGWDPSGAWSGAVLQRLSGVDVFVPNEVEALRYTRTDDVTAAVKQLAEHVGTVVVTRGAQGAIAADSATGEWVELPAVPVTVADPTGAGDVFVAALMTAAVHGWGLPTRVRFAGLLASLSVRALGGATSAPRPADVAAFLRVQRPPGDWTDIEDWAHRRALEEETR